MRRARVKSGEHSLLDASDGELDFARAEVGSRQVPRLDAAEHGLRRGEPAPRGPGVAYRVGKGVVGKLDVARRSFGDATLRTEHEVRTTLGVWF